MPFAVRIEVKFQPQAKPSTVLPAKSDSYVMFCLQSYQGLILDRSQVIYRFALLKWSVQVKVLLNNCKQNITTLSLLVGVTVLPYSEHVHLHLRKLV